MQGIPLAGRSRRRAVLEGSTRTRAVLEGQSRARVLLEGSQAFVGPGAVVPEGALLDEEGNVLTDEDGTILLE